jgi:hypothetical protein
MNRDWFALSIRQPWIDLILKGLKKIEVRDWNVTRRGPILLHASQTVDWQAIDLFGYANPWALPRGRIVGCARIVDAFEFARATWLERASQHLVIRPLGAGNYGAVLEDVRPLKRTAACSGKLYFFPVPLAVWEKIEEEVEEYASQASTHLEVEK